MAIRRFTVTAEKSGHSGTEESARSRKRACLLPVCEQPHLQPTSRDSPGPGLHSTPKQYLNTSPPRGILQRSGAGWKSQGGLSVSFVWALTKGQSRKRSKASDCPGEGDRRYLLHDQNVKHVQDDEHQAFPPQREKGDWLGLGRPAALRPGGDWQRGGRGQGRKSYDPAWPRSPAQNSGIQGSLPQPVLQSEALLGTQKADGGLFSTTGGLQGSGRVPSATEKKEGPGPPHRRTHRGE